MSDTRETITLQCPDCRGFGYTIGSKHDFWDKLTCETCKGKGKLEAAADPEDFGYGRGGG